MILSLLGTAGIVTAIVGALILIRNGWRSSRHEPVSLGKGSRYLTIGAVSAFGALIVALMVDDFSTVYVANHHSRLTPFPFDLATAWAALEGSIVLWGLILAVFARYVVRKYEDNPDPQGAAAGAVMGVIALFFFVLMITVSNPFEVCTQALAIGCGDSSPWPFAAASVPLNGPGPNPLLQNHVLMAIHPPLLYVGYVGMAVPFAYAIGELAVPSGGDTWLRRSHRATLIAWSFLTLGITIGAWWAYEVLSWGGYWAWDPVENASLMPWLAATAFLHSALVQRRKQTLQAWNFVLVISVFSLTILGTFLTRSGTINSVHSFTQSAIGPALLGFLAVIVIGSFALFALRADTIASENRIEHLVSREGSFLANNLILTVYGFVVLVGTVYPLVVEAFGGVQVGVGRPFFDRLAVPLSFLLLLVMGLGPLVPWNGLKTQTLWQRVRIPVLTSLFMGVLVAAVVTPQAWVVLAVVFGTFVIAGILSKFLQALARRRGTSPSLISAIGATLGSQPGFWAGQLSHIGVAVVAIGLAFVGNLGLQTEVTMETGDSFEFSGYELVYVSPFQQQEANRVVQGARFSILREGVLLTTLEPSVNIYSGSMAIGTPAVHNGLTEDLYLSLIRPPTASAVTVKLNTSPMIWLLWLGGITTAVGGFFALGDRRRTGTPSRASVDV